MVGIAGLASSFMVQARSASRHYRIGMLDTSALDRNPNFRAFRDALSNTAISKVTTSPSNIVRRLAETRALRISQTN